MIDFPRQDDLASMRILEEIQANPEITQRELSRKVGVSLGLTNLLLRKMARKAWIKMRSVPGRRLLYALTPKGLGEKLRKTRDFVRLSLRYYRDVRRSLAEQIRKTGRKRPRVACAGTGELSGIVAEAARSAGGTYLGAVDPAGPDGRADVIVLLQKAPRAQRQSWERNGVEIIDLT